MTVKEIMQLFHQKVGRGREADIEDAIGKGRGYLRKCRYRESIDLGVFLEALDAAGIHPGQFFTEAFGDPPEGDDDFEPPVSGISKTVRKARRRRAAGGKGKVTNAQLVDVDTRLRHDDPVAAVEFIDRHIGDVDAADVPFALGIYASACKPLLRRSEALEAVFFALRMAAAMGNLRRKADLLQRYSHLKASLDADHEFALEVSAAAMATYNRLADTHGMGKVFVDQGAFHYNLGALDEALSSFEAALGLLNDSDDSFRCAAYQGQGVIWVSRGENRKAEALFHCALNHARTEIEAGKLSWLKGMATRDSQDFENAFGKLAPTSPVDASLVACDHVQLLLEDGFLQEAAEVISRTRSLLEPLRMTGNPIAIAALRDLICREMDGHKLTATFVRAVAERLRSSVSRQVPG